MTVHVRHGARSLLRKVRTDGQLPDVGCRHTGRTAGQQNAGTVVRAGERSAEFLIRVQGGISAGLPSSCAFFRKRITKASHFIHQARHSFSRHRNEGRILVPALITRVDISRMLHQRRSNDFAVIKIRPSFGATAIGDSTHSHKIHCLIVVQGPDEPGPRSSRRTQLLDLFKLTFMHTETFHPTTRGRPAKNHAGRPRPDHA